MTTRAGLILFLHSSSRPSWISVRFVCAYAYGPIAVTVLSHTPSFESEMLALHGNVGGMKRVGLTNVVCHDVKPVNMFLQIDDVKPLHVPVRCRLKQS
jgi:hypothetical protein